MPVLDALRKISRFGYDAIIDRGRRRAPTATTQHADRELDQSGRRKLAGSAREITRNYSVAAWMIRRHLDFVSQFDFRARTPDKGLNRDLEHLVRVVWNRPAECDAAGRHTFAKMLRLAEASRTIDGDVGILMLANGRIQGIEGDRIRNPSIADMIGRTDADQWRHGVKTNNAGRALAYALHDRIDGTSAFRFDRTVRASRMHLHGFFHRFDQTRGVSPIAQALNPLQDVYEAHDYALAKAKVSQLFALAIYSQSQEQTGGIHEGIDDDGDGTDERYQVDFGKGPVKLELDEGDRAEFLESQQPSSQFQEFTKVVLSAALKALDIPFNFYDESHTNFFGSRAAWLLYERAAVDKRNDVAELLRRLTVWRIMLWILDGQITLPRGQSVADVAFEWVPRGIPWWDPVKEINGDTKAISAALTTPQQVCRQRGTGDFHDNVDQIAEAIAYAKAAGVPLSWAVSGAPPANASTPPPPRN